jgi:hypothetical protein
MEWNRYGEIDPKLIYDNKKKTTKGKKQKLKRQK